MKTVYFTEEQLKDPNDIGRQLFNDENDPRSMLYKRTLNRPQIKLFKTFLFFVIVPAVGLCGLIALLSRIGLSAGAITAISAAAFLTFLIAAMKQILISAIKIYQKYAPDAVRNKCRFEPSCSEYAILALQKYGLLKGLKKTIGRLKRCNIRGGGFDNP